MRLEIDKRRRYVRIKLLDDDGNVAEEYVASADSGLTWPDDIWFGTSEEYDQAVRELLD